MQDSEGRVSPLLHLERGGYEGTHKPNKRYPFGQAGLDWLALGLQCRGLRISLDWGPLLRRKTTGTGS